jgi:hypothetical protein
VFKFEDLDIDLIGILSDDAGHAKRELKQHFEELYGPSTYRKITGSLERMQNGFEDRENVPDDDFYIDWFNLGDIKDPLRLRSVLITAKDPLSRFMNDGIPPKLKQILMESHDPHELRSVLKKILNEVADGTSIFDKNRFEDVNLSEATRKSLEKNFTGWGIHRCNRLLLGDAYPNEISRRQKAIIIKGPNRPTTRKDIKGKDYREEPYFLNRDPAVFKLIIYYLKNRQDKFHEIWCTLIMNLEERKQEMLFERCCSDDEFEKLKLEIISYESFEGLNLESCERVAHKNNEYFEKFLSSRYTGNLIEDYGLPLILEIMQSLSVSVTKCKYLVERAYENKSITKDEFEKADTKLGPWIEVDCP